MELELRTVYGTRQKFIGEMLKGYGAKIAQSEMLSHFASGMVGFIAQTILSQYD